MKSKITVIVILLILIGLGFTYWSSHIRDDKDRTAAQAHSSYQSGNDAGTVQADKQSGIQGSKKIYQFNSLTEYENVSRYGKLPSFFEGTYIFTSLSDEAGNLMITRKIRSLFEYFFMALSEEDLATVTGRIREYIQLTLQDKAAEEALSIFKDYLDYRNALSGFRSSDEFMELKSDRTALFSKLKAIRRQYFKPEVVEAFFSDEEASINYSLRSDTIKSNTSLSQEQQDEMLAKLEEQLPEKQREQIRYKREKERLEEKIKQLQASGENADEIYELRKDFYGEIIAKRMTFMYDSSDEWNSRVDEYIHTKETIMADPDLTEEEKDRRIYDQRHKLFTEEEQKKILYHELKRQLDQKNTLKK